MRWRSFTTLLLLSASFFLLANAQDIYPFTNPAQTQQFIRLTHELRCLVCQNQDLADSQAGLADDLRQQVYKMIKNGQSDAQIKNYLIQRYGEFILFQPPFSINTYLLWFAPLLMLLIGVLVIKGILKK